MKVNESALSTLDFTIFLMFLEIGEEGGSLDLKRLLSKKITCSKSRIEQANICWVSKGVQ